MHARHVCISQFPMVQNPPLGLSTDGAHFMEYLSHTHKSPGLNPQHHTTGLQGHTTLNPSTLVVEGRD